MEEELENTSGQGEGSVVPERVSKRFNWGAFTFSWIWGIGNNTKIVIGIGLTLLAFYLITGFKLMVLVCLPFDIWFGIKGNTWAWQNKKWETLERFHKIQRIWATIATIVLSIIVICYLLYFLLIASALVYLSKNMETIEKEPTTVSKTVDINKTSTKKSNLPPQTYKEWQQLNDKNYVPQEKKQLPNVKVNVKVKSKQVPQTYEEWEKKNR